MIRHIVAVDSSMGFAKLDANGVLGIPWSLPGDTAYYRDHVSGKRLLMGRLSYDEKRAQQATYNYVLTHDKTMQVANGETVASVEDALAKNKAQDLWVIGGESVYAATIAQADELYITRVDGDFACDRFYPNIPTIFTRTYVSKAHHENGHMYHFEIYTKHK
jgi:dihydrofolate reductase